MAQSTSQTLPVSEVALRWQAATAGLYQGDLYFLSEVGRGEEIREAARAMPVSYNGFERPSFKQAVKYLKPVGLQVGREGSPVAYLHFETPEEAAEAVAKARRFRLADEIGQYRDQQTVVRMWWD
jgi:hypothetical protein